MVYVWLWMWCVRSYCVIDSLCMMWYGLRSVIWVLVCVYSELVLVYGVISIIYLLLLLITLTLTL